MLPLLPLLLACTETPGPSSALRWAKTHEITLDAVRLPTDRLLGKLPSLPGAPFRCSGFVLPAEIPTPEHERLHRDLCRQQATLWETSRREAEEKLGTELLTGAFLHYGVVGVSLSISGPDGVELQDHRGITTFANDDSAPAATSQILDPRGDLLGHGLVDLRTEPEEPPALHPALEWRHTTRRGDASAEVQLFVQIDGHPDADFVRHAMSR